jgi:hypothetical protein
MEKGFSNDNLIEFYTEKLQDAGISSAADLKKAVEEGSIDLSFNASNVISPERQQKIIENNPDNIEIGDKTYDVTYSYNHGLERHVASITVPAENIFGIDEVPSLPSGRNLSVVVDAFGRKSSGKNLEELKKETESYLLSKQWEDFKSPDVSKKQELEGFDPTTDTLPELPAPVTYGINPRTQKPAVAYAALTYNPSYWPDGRYYITYYETQEGALEAQEQAFIQIESAKERKRIEEERQQLIAPAKEALKEVTDLYSQIRFNHEPFGLTWNDMQSLGDLVRRLQYYDIDQNPQVVLDRVAEIRVQMASAFEIKEKKDVVNRKIEELTEENHTKCPFCGGDLSYGSCDNEHDLKSIQFETDGYGREIGPVLLSQIKVVTEEGEKIVSRLWCSAGTGRKYYRGDVYLEKENALEPDERWEGQIGDVVFEDFKHTATDKGTERLSVSEAAVFLGDTSMAAAFERAMDAANGPEITSIAQESEKGDAELTGWKRRKLEEQLAGAEKKLRLRELELERMLEKEQETALNVRSGDVETEISKPGIRVVADFDKTDDQGNIYAEVVEWPLNRVLHLQVQDLQGTQYVEVVELDENETFYSEELGLTGITLKVKKVDLAEKDEIVNTQQDKIRKIRRRLEQ